MVKDKCSMMHKLGPFVLDNKGGATRKCFCCEEIIKYDTIGDDIKEAVMRQEDVKFFSDLLIGKKVNFTNNDYFMIHVRYLLDDIDYLFVNEKAQQELIDGIKYYNNILNMGENDKYNLINDVINYLKLNFKRNNYEYKYGFGSFQEEDNERIDSILEGINKKYNKLEHKKNHLK